MKKKNILILCTGNSCRSQMAHGFGNHYKNSDFTFYSAGVTKHGLNTRAVKVMNEVGIDISHHESSLIKELDCKKFDYVITVCSDAHETCPIFTGGKVVHYGFDDPPRLTKEMDDEEEIMSVYRRVRDEIKNMILNIEKILG